MIERIDAFLAYLSDERGVSANTVSAYRNDLSQFGEYLDERASKVGGGPLPLSGVDRERVVGFLLYLRERSYAPASVARKIAALKSFFHYLLREGEVASDPTDGLESPEVKKAQPHAISSNDIESLFEQAQLRDSPEGQRDVAMLRVLYGTGMRVSELMMLDTIDLDLEKGTARVVGRGGRARVVPIDPLTARTLREYLTRSRPYIVRHYPDQTAVFVNHRGQRLTRQGFWLIMKALVKDSGLSKLVTPHTLRHSFASHQIDEGLALQQLQRLLGHASISTTQIYAQGSRQPVKPTKLAPTPRRGGGTRALVGA